MVTIETKHEHKIKELKQKIEQLEIENEILKQHCNLSDIENTYEEYDNLKFDHMKASQNAENDDQEA